MPVQGAAPAVHQAIEFGNRLLTFVLVAFVVAVYVAVRAAHRRREIIMHALIQGLGIVAQAVIGGISVWLQLAWWSVALHFLPSMLLVWLAAILYLRIGEPDDAVPARTYSSGLRLLGAVFAAGIALVLTTGTLVTGAGQHSGDAAVGEDSRLQVPLELIAHVHAWVLYASLAILVVLVVLLRRSGAPAAVQKTGWALVGIIVVQALVGIAQFRLGVPRWSIPIHVCLSSVIVAVSSLLYAQGWARPALDQDPRHTTGSPSWGTIAVTTFFTNSRHIFYGLTYPLHAVRGWWARAYAVFTLADETYALVSALPADARTSRRILTITAGLHLHWLAGSTVGAVFASHMLGTIPGLDFILVGLFAVLAMDVLAQSRDARTAGLATACATVGLVAAPHHMLLVAMTLFAVLLGIRYRL